MCSTPWCFGDCEEREADKKYEQEREEARDKTYNPFFSAWRKGDLIKIYGKEIRLTSEAYEKMGVGIVCDTNEGEEAYIKYINLIDDAKLIETISGRKNLVI